MGNEKVRFNKSAVETSLYMGWKLESWKAGKLEVASASPMERKVV